MTTMERLRLGEVEVSRIVYGMWRLADDPDRSPDHVRRKVEACLEQGITTFDQADIYGDYESEGVFGECLRAAPGLRERIEIVTKCDIHLMSDKAPDRRVKHYDTSPEHIRASVENSLSRMGIEVIDVLLLHRPDPLMDHRATAGTLDALMAEGKVREVGVSNFRPHDWTLLSSALSRPLVTNQIELSLMALDPFTDGDLAFLQERDVPPMAWSPLAGGALVSGPEEGALRTVMARVARDRGVDLAAVAVAFLLRHPARILPVMGTNNAARIASFKDALTVDLDRETWFELYEAALGHEVP